MYHSVSGLCGSKDRDLSLFLPRVYACTADGTRLFLKFWSKWAWLSHVSYVQVKEKDCLTRLMMCMSVLHLCSSVRETGVISRLMVS